MVRSNRLRTLRPSPDRHSPTRLVLTTVVFPILLGLAIVLVLALTPWGNERVRQLVVSQANDRLHGELAVGSLRGNLLSGATLTDVEGASFLRKVMRALGTLLIVAILVGIVLVVSLAVRRRRGKG